MRRYNNWDKVEANKGFDKLKAGGYVVIIKNVKDVTDKEYLEIAYDICEGEFKDYYRQLYDSQNFWGGRFYRSYKESAIGFFKAFIQDVEESNPHYAWDWNENLLKNKFVGIVLQEEEYIPQQGQYVGQVRTRLALQETKPVSEIRSGNFTVRAIKKLAQDNNTSTNSNPFKDTKFDIKDDDIQF